MLDYDNDENSLHFNLQFMERFSLMLPSVLGLDLHIWLDTYNGLGPLLGSSRYGLLSDLFN